jgi:Na+-translocating ferredoxin:NAD+ oxidoreductase RnfG subunit
MNKKLSISLGIISVIAIGFGALSYQIKGTIEERHLAISNNIENLNKSLPPQFKFKLISQENGIFESVGQYQFSYTDAINKTNSGALVIDYKTSHGFDTLINGDIKFLANGKSEGEIFNKLQVKSANNPGFSFQIEGLIKPDGSIISKNTLNDFSLIIPKPVFDNPLEANVSISPNGQPNSEQPTIKKDSIVSPNKQEANKTGLLIDVKGASGELNFTATTGNIENNFSYNSIIAQDLEDLNDKIVTNGLTVNYSTNINNFEIGNFKFTAKSINNGTDFIKANGVELEASVDKINNKYDVKFGSKVAKLSFLNQKDSTFEFSYSLKGIDNRMMNLYKKVTTVYAAGGEFTEKDSKEAQQVFIDSLKTGLIFSIDKVLFGNDKTKFEFNGNYEIVATPNGKDFSFANQSKFGVKVEAQGEIAQMANSLLMPMLGGDFPQSANQNNNPNIFKLNLNYNNGILKINNLEIQNGSNEIINSSLKNIDIQLGLAKPEIIEPIISLENQTIPQTEKIMPEQIIKSN